MSLYAISSLLGISFLVAAVVFGSAVTFILWRCGLVGEDVGKVYPNDGSAHVEGE